VLSAGLQFIDAVLCRLEKLTKWRLYSTSRVLLCTIDSMSRMTSDIQSAAAAAERSGVRGWTLSIGELTDVVLYIYRSALCKLYSIVDQCQ
jgi:hypothetical protein